MIQHVPHEGAGLIASLASERGIDLRVHRMDLGQALPDVAALGGLVVMGGPMGVYEGDRYPILRLEQELLAQAVDRGLPVLGVCLGAQLLAAALGGRVYRGPIFEIGAGTVEVTEAGRNDAVLGAELDPIPVVHWHQDTFTLPPGAVHLAASARYPHQAFRAGRRAYGFQFHVEVDVAVAEEWRPELPADVELTPAQQLAIEAAGRRILGRFFDLGLS